MRENGESERMAELEHVIIRNYGNIAGMVVLKDGITAYEKYFDECTAERPVHVFSVTKSILSILIGIAVDKGYIAGVNQKVLDFFPDYTVRQKEKTIQQVTLKDVLTMTAPYKYKFAPYIKYFTSDDWVKTSLDYLGGRGTIGQFRYTPVIGPDILSGILANATGESVLEFAAKHLFAPLGIHIPKSIVFKNKEEQMAFYQAKHATGWVAGPTGVNTSGWGLTLTARDMANIGQLYLQKGKWEGKQLVSAWWVDESTKEQSRWDAQKLSYGYLWWVDESGYAAMGDGGNVIYVNTEKKLVVSIASYFRRNAKNRIAFIKQYVEPLFLNP